MMKSLVVDAGNTSLKAGVFEVDRLLEHAVCDRHNHESLQVLLDRHRPTVALLSNVGSELPELEQLLASRTVFSKLTHDTFLPFRSTYATPSTLGMDRVAAVAGAMQLYPKTNCLVIDAGTCVTYDFISADGLHAGGAIAPGLHMRLRAMHHFTGKLPHVEFAQPGDFIGDSTTACMNSGAFFGMVGEINEMIVRYEERFGDLQVILCGGDATVFDKHIKRSIFAAPLLVLFGLNKILRFNAS